MKLNQNIKTRTQGFSLIELMIAIAVIGVITAISVPMYQDYVDTAARGAMRQNMDSIALFQEERKLSGGSYYAGTYDPADTDNTAGIKKVMGWAPNTGKDIYLYEVSNVTRNSFTITATDQETPDRVETKDY